MSTAACAWVSLALAACSVDAVSADGGVDAPPDDAGVDAARADAGPRLPAPWPGYEHAVGVPFGCDVQFATDLGAPVAFVPCAEPSAGCRELDVASLGVAGLSELSFAAARDGGSLLLTAGARGTRGGTDYVMFAPDGTVRLRAWVPGFYVGHCNPSLVTGTDGFALRFTVFTSADAYRTTYAVGELDRPLETTHVLATIGGGDGGTAVTSHGVVVAGDLRIDSDGAVFDLAPAGTVEWPSMRDSTIFFTRYALRDTVRVSRTGGDSYELFGHAAPTLLFATDGVDMVWLRGEQLRGSTQFTRLELVTAPFTLDPSAVRARGIAPVDPHRYGPTYVGGGRAAIPTNSNEITIWDLGTLRAHRLVVRAPASWQGAVALGDTELSVAVGAGGRTRTLQVIRYDSL